MSKGEFSVYQFFNDGTNECVRLFVDAHAAVEGAKRYTESVGARLGTTQRVIITDGGDYTTFEWKHGEGVVYPPPSARSAGDLARGESPSTQKGS